MPRLGQRDRWSNPNAFKVDGRPRRFFCPNCDPLGVMERDARLNETPKPGEGAA